MVAYKVDFRSRLYCLPGLGNHRPMTCILEVGADEVSSPGYMITFDPLSTHGASAGSASLFSEAAEYAPRLFRPLSLAPLSHRTIPGEGGARVPHPPTGWQRRGTWCGLRSVPRARKKTWRSLIFCWKCGVQPVRSMPAPRYPQRPPVAVDVEKIQARRHQVLAAMEGRPGQLRKSRVADEFDAFILVISAGCRGWTTVTPDDLFDFLCYLDTKGNHTKMVHEASCPGVGRVGDNACWEGSLCVRRYAPESLRKGFVSKLKMAMKEHGKGEEWDPVQFHKFYGRPFARVLYVFLKKDIGR